MNALLAVQRVSYRTNDKSEYLTCQACAQPFRQDSASFGCAECDEDICYKCVKGLPESLKRKSVRERLKPGSGHFSTQP